MLGVERGHLRRVIYGHPSKVYHSCETPQGGQIGQNVVGLGHGYHIDSWIP